MTEKERTQGCGIQLHHQGKKTERENISLSLIVPWVGLDGGGNRAWVELEDAMKKAYLHFWQNALKSLLMKAFDF